jgi:hypothetical protein
VPPGARACDLIFHRDDTFLMQPKETPMTTTNPTTTTSNDTATDARHTAGVQPETDYVLDEAVGAFARIGLMWARHGIGIGRSALEASALTLRTTADVLRAVSERLEVPEKATEPGAAR